MSWKTVNKKDVFVTYTWIHILCVPWLFWRMDKIVTRLDRLSKRHANILQIHFITVIKCSMCWATAIGPHQVSVCEIFWRFACLSIKHYRKSIKANVPVFTGIEAGNHRPPFSFWLATSKRSINQRYRKLALQFMKLWQKLPLFRQHLLLLSSSFQLTMITIDCRHQ